MCEDRLTGMCPSPPRIVFLHRDQPVLGTKQRRLQTHHPDPGHHLALETGGHWPAGREG